MAPQGCKKATQGSLYFTTKQGSSSWHVVREDSREQSVSGHSMDASCETLGLTVRGVGSCFSVCVWGGGRAGVSLRLPRNPLSVLEQASLPLIHVLRSQALSHLYGLLHFRWARLSSSSHCPRQMEELGGATEAPDISSCNRELQCFNTLKLITMQGAPRERRGFLLAPCHSVSKATCSTFSDGCDRGQGS